MRTFLAATLAAVMVLLSIPANAGHCTTYSTSVNDEDTLIIQNPAAPIYHVWDHCQPECLFSYWAYEETNGIPGLQRGDMVVDDTCHWMIEADTWIY